MALTDIFISPAGAGDNSGSSVANALPAISSGDWSTNIEGLDRANKRFVFLSGTYACTTKLAFSGSAPSATQPNQWVGADSSGNILRPKFQESGLHLDLTNYPLFVCSANVAMVDTEENTYYKCLSFENTSTSYSLTSVVETQTADVDQQHWVGCNFKCKARNTSAHCATVTTAAYHNCVFHMDDTAQSTFDAVVKSTNNTTLDNCRIIGPVGPGEAVIAAGGDQGGLYITALTTKVRNCVITNVGGIGVNLDATSNKAEIDVANCTICKVGGDGINCTGNSSALPGKGSLQGNIIFDCTGNGIEANSDDSRQSGAQILAMGSNDAGNFANMDSYEDMIDVIAITTADFVDYANKDYRIKRTSPLYKFHGDRNFGAIQNEDYEFVSVS
tara:strand:+ start:1932 stop:3095 length:1164 start_codon:yes stop_codon:yes gene_type:complete